MTDHIPDIELSTARILRAILIEDAPSLGQALFELEQANVAGLAVTAFAQLYIDECLKTMKRDTLVRAAEARIGQLLQEEN